MKTTRNDTSFYTVTHNDDAVDVWMINDAPPGVFWWVAAAQWDAALWSGPHRTKAQAVHHAKLMLTTKPA